MRAALLRIGELDSRTLGAWRELAGAALEPNPFFAPDLAAAAARWLPGGGHDRLLAVFERSDLVLALPVRRVPRYRRIPVPTFLAWGHRHAYLDTPLVTASDPEAAFATALHAAGAAGAGWLVLERASGEGPVRRALEAALRARAARATVLVQHSRPMVRRRPESTYLDGRLSPRRRKRLGSQSRGLARALGATPEIHESVGPAFGAALERFLMLEQIGWKGRAGTALASVQGEAAFFRDAMSALAARGEAQVWELRAGDVTLASLCAVLDGGGMFHLKTAYDERFARYSPGVQLELGVLEAFHRDRSLGWIDSCTGEGPSPSALLYPDRCLIQSVVAPLRSGPGRLAAPALRDALRVRRWVEARRGAPERAEEGGVAA